MSEQITFTTAAFGGFEKKQVLDYIYLMHEEIDKERNNHQRKLNEISIAFKELETRAVNSEKKQKIFENELVNAQEALESERQSKEQYKLLNQELKMKLDQCQRIIEQRKKQDEESLKKQEELAAMKLGDSPEPQASSQPIGSPSPKVEEHSEEDSTIVIGRVMLEAHSKANSIIKDAKLEAEKILNDANFSIEQTRKQYQREVDEYRAKVESELNQLLELSNQRFHDNMVKIYDYAKAMMDDISFATNKASANFVAINEQVISMNTSTQTIKQNISSNLLETISIPRIEIPSTTITVKIVEPESKTPQPSIVSNQADPNSYSSQYEKLFSDNTDYNKPIMPKPIIEDEVVQKPEPSAYDSDTESSNDSKKSEFNFLNFPSLDPPTL